MAFAFIADLPFHSAVLFVVCILAVCLFEAINGFHDTANAVATVIYTNTLKPLVAVIWSGIWNFLGVMLGGIAVAMGIFKLIPVNDLMMQTVGENSAMVLSVLIAAIAWNLGTWYFGIPCSSSHTLIGALLGAGFAFWSVHQGSGPNWAKAGDIGLSLLISPFFGFTLAIILMYLLKVLLKNKAIFEEPSGKKTPPTWIRAILIFTCTLVSFFHGSNDGQKGVGLMLVVLIAFMPMQYSFNHKVPSQEYAAAARNISATLKGVLPDADPVTVAHVEAISTQADQTAVQIDTCNFSDKQELFAVRQAVQKLNKTIEGDLKGKVIPTAAVSTIKKDVNKLKTSYEFAPLWVVILISICLGAGTMVGWKRIVVTIGEKIGKTHLTYAQGASAEICAATTIGVSTGLGLPVSTTHVLSSGIAGTMVASGGIKNLQRKTIKNIALAWLLTLPVSFLLAAMLFFGLRLVL